MKVCRNFIDNSKNYFRAQKGVTVADYFRDWTLWEKLWISVSTVVILVASIFTWDTTNALASWVALVSSITGIWCVILVAKGRISNYVFGLINVIAYAYSAYLWRLYGDAMLNAFYFLPMQFYGWYLWVSPKNVEAKDTVVMKRLSIRGAVTWGIVSIIGVIGYGVILKAMGGLTPYFDSMSTVLSVIAMILMAYLYAEQWILWIIVDLVTVYMWANIVINEGGLFAIGILLMWIAFLVNATYGYVNWLKGSSK